MEPKFSKLEAEVDLLLRANNSPSTIISTLKRSSKTIYNTISRVKKKKDNISPLSRVKASRVSKLSSREKRVILRDLERSPY